MISYERRAYESVDEMSLYIILGYVPKNDEKNYLVLKGSNMWNIFTRKERGFNYKNLYICSLKLPFEWRKWLLPAIGWSKTIINNNESHMISKVICVDWWQEK